MRCQVCGAEAPEGDRHCTHCGAPLTEKMRPEAKVLLSNLKDHLKGMRESLQTISFQPPKNFQSMLAAGRQAAPAANPGGEAVESLDFRIAVVEGRRAGEVFEVGRIITFGRAENCEVQLTDIAVSREHCRIVFHPERRVFLLQDLGSHNGTLLNGQPAKKAELKSGDRIKVGESTILFYRAPLPDDLRAEFANKGVRIPDSPRSMAPNGASAMGIELPAVGSRRQTEVPTNPPQSRSQPALVTPPRPPAWLDSAFPQAPAPPAENRPSNLPSASPASQQVDDPDEMATVQLEAMSSISLLRSERSMTPEVELAPIEGSDSEPEISPFEPTATVSAIDDQVVEQIISSPALHSPELMPAPATGTSPILLTKIPSTQVAAVETQPPLTPSPRGAGWQEVRATSEPGGKSLLGSGPQQAPEEMVLLDSPIARPGPGEAEMPSKTPRPREDLGEASGFAAPDLFQVQQSPGAGSTRRGSPPSTTSPGSPQGKPSLEKPTVAKVAPASKPELSPARPVTTPARALPQPAIPANRAVPQPTSEPEPPASSGKLFYVLLILLLGSAALALMWYLFLR